MAEEQDFDAVSFLDVYYERPAALEALVKALAALMREEGYAVTAGMIGEVLVQMGQDALKVVPKGGYKGWIEEE
jgi:hypothetical protein